MQCIDCEGKAVVNHRCWECHRRYRKRQRKVSPKKRSVIFRRDGGRCVYCGCYLLEQPHPLRCRYAESGEYWDVDHRTPVDSFGTNDIGNLQLTCSMCNADKGGLRDREYRDVLASRVEFEESVESMSPEDLLQCIMERRSRHRETLQEQVDSIDNIMRRPFEH